MKRYLIMLFLIAGFYSCKEKTPIFKGEVFIIDEPDIDTLYGSKVEIDGIYTGAIFVYDSLIMFKSEKYRAAFGCEGLVFNVKTGKQISSIVKVGQGPKDFVSPYFPSQYDTVNNGIGMWFYDYSKKKHVLVSLADNSWKKVINLSDLEHERSAPAMQIFIINDSLLLIYNQGEESFVSENILLPPSYYLFNINTNKSVAKYDFFNSFKYNTEIPPPMCLSTEDIMKPDRTQLAMGMMYARQINILDVKSGEITGYRLKNSPDLDVVREGGKQYSDLKYFYYNLRADNEFIYAKLGNGTVDVFTWDGSLKRKLKFDKKPYDVALDEVNKCLYTIVVGKEDEEIYRYDVNYLYE
jgi:hypothetical protein